MLSNRGDVKPSKATGRITQRRVAELAGVSQATVSLVLNNRETETKRIAPATRDRILEIIRETTYVADPAARRLAGVDNKIIGVFTYEPAFPADRADFYTPLLTGLETEAERLGCDLLLFTSAPVTNGRRELFHPNNRLGFADGCILLGREMDATDLERLVHEKLPFVAVGRRDTPGVPYVGVNYAPAISELVELAIRHGHRRFLYLGLEGDGESLRDRRAAFNAALAKTLDASVTFFEAPVREMNTAWAAVEAASPTVVFLESDTQAAPLARIAAQASVSVPDDLSIVVLGDASWAAGDLNFTRLTPPREELGEGAVRMLARLIAVDAGVPLEGLQVLLECGIDEGATLTSPKPSGNT